MADGQLLGLFKPKTGQNVQAFGAALSGDLPAFRQTQALQREQQQELSDDRKRALLVDNRGVRRLLEAGNTGQAIQLLRNRVAEVDRLDGDASDTIGLMSQIESGDIDGALSEVVRVDNFAVDSGILDEFPVSATADGTNKVVQSSKILPGGVVQIVFKDGSIETREGTPEEIAIIQAAEDRGTTLAVERARQKSEGVVTGKGEAGRVQKTIQLGIDAVQGIPILRRSLQLLERIETGGIDAARLRAKQLFGVEGADEGELSANLGKAVLSRLRETFGAQFTEREGARLERMSAGFGKSAAANKRILRSSLKIIDNAAQRALEAARDSGDTAAEEQLLDFIDGRFDLTDQGLAEIFTQEQATAGAASDLTDEELLQQLGQ